MSTFVRGIGLAVPPHTMTQQQALELARGVNCRSEQQQRLATTLYRKSGVLNRHTSLPYELGYEWLRSNPTNESAAGPQRGPSTGQRMELFAELAPLLAKSASAKALAAAATPADEITHLVVVSCTGFQSPGLDHALMSSLSLSPTTERLQIGFMGCHGAINGLRAALAICESTPSAHVLLSATELSSVHYQLNWNADQMVAQALFADGAAAVVLSSQSFKNGNPWRLAATGSCLIPNSAAAMGWKIGDHGFEMKLDACVPELIKENLRPWLTKWLSDHDLTLQNVGSWAIHPGGPRILTAIEQSLDLSTDQTAASREILANYGNMSSPTVLFIVNRLRELHSPMPCVALGFGPGMFAEAALFV
ncbi:MAG TPA: type III polyketide synthase [Pirellulaceae bacterium]|jgi:predicted naringenin-chalcone synthase